MRRFRYKRGKKVPPDGRGWLEEFVELVFGESGLFDDFLEQ